MNLSPPVRAAVLEVVRRLRSPEREATPEAVGAYIRCQFAHNLDASWALREVRAALGLDESDLASIPRWARGKSREEVAAALERVATSEASPR